jgi:hypothetical protein
MPKPGWVFSGLTFWNILIWKLPQNPFSFSSYTCYSGWRKGFFIEIVMYIYPALLILS